MTLFVRHLQHDLTGNQTWHFLSSLFINNYIKSNESTIHSLIWTTTPLALWVTAAVDGPFRDGIVLKCVPCLTVHLQGPRWLGFAHAVLWHAGVSALVLTSHLGQTQTVVAADLKSGKNMKTFLKTALVGVIFDANCKIVGQLNLWNVTKCRAIRRWGCFCSKLLKCSRQYETVWYIIVLQLEAPCGDLDPADNEGTFTPFPLRDH